LHYAVNVQTNMPAGLFTNDTRWNGFRWWSQALGFGQEALKALAVDADSKAKIIPDPTVAVIDVDPASVRRRPPARTADSD
jgi:cyanophycinase-like exopeptidase